MHDDDQTPTQNLYYRYQGQHPHKYRVTGSIMAINEAAAGDDSVAITGTATGERTIGVVGEGSGFGVNGRGGTGVVGVSPTWLGVYGESNALAGPGAAGLWGEGKENSHGVKGHASGEGVAAVARFQLTNKGPGIHGEGGTGVNGVGKTWVGVYGETHGDRSVGPSGVLGEGLEGGVGVKGHAWAEGMAGVAAYHLTGRGPGVYAEGAPAGHFHGDVEVTGDLRLLGADVAEQFDVLDDVDPGTIVVLDDDGAIGPCRKAYDRRVAGVVSGAGDRRPALVLDRQDSGARRRAVAMLGKAWCRADASARPVEVGDLLTTSTTAGHAMTAVDRDASFGAMLGKALTPLATGTGLVLVLVGLG